MTWWLSTASEHGATLVTNNIKGFARVPGFAGEVSWAPQRRGKP